MIDFVAAEAFPANPTSVIADNETTATNLKFLFLFILFAPLQALNLYLFIHFYIFSVRVNPRIEGEEIDSKRRVLALCYLFAMSHQSELN